MSHDIIIIPTFFLQDMLGGNLQHNLLILRIPRIFYIAGCISAAYCTWS